MIKKIATILSAIFILIVIVLVVNINRKEHYDKNKAINWHTIDHRPIVNAMDDSLLEKLNMCAISIKIVPLFNDPLISKCSFILDITYEPSLKHSIDIGTIEEALDLTDIPCKKIKTHVALTIGAYDEQTGLYYCFPSKALHPLFLSDSVTIFLYNQIVQDAHGHFRVVAGHDVKDDYTDSD